MGVVRQGHALSEDLGPGFGRRMGMTRSEGEASHAVGRRADEAGQQHTGHGQTPGVYVCPRHPEVRSDKPDKYEEVMKRVREGRVEKPEAPAHKH